jgi:sugar lactone lactonase YvrE
VTARIRLTGNPTGLAYGDGFTWVTAGGTFHGVFRQRLYKIDPRRARIAGVGSFPGTRSGCAVFPGPQGLWAACAGASRVSLIDPASLSVLNEVPTGPTGGAPQVIPRQRVVWVLTGDGLLRVDPDSCTVSGAVRKGWPQGFTPPLSMPGFAADGQGRIWVVNQGLDVVQPASLAVHRVGGHALEPTTNVFFSGGQLWTAGGRALVEIQASPPRRPGGTRR